MTQPMPPTTTGNVSPALRPAAMPKPMPAKHAPAHRIAAANRRTK